MTTMLRLRADRLRWTVVDDEVVVVDGDTSTYLAANPSGAVLWRALADGAIEDTLVALLVDTYALERERAAADVAAFLGDLRRRGCLEA
jgi:hypothetical protein